MASPLEQFVIQPVVPAIGLTNASVFMMASVGVVVGGLMLATGSRQLVPGRVQSVAEILHEFIADLLRGIAGEEAMVFFPLVFSLFMFIFTANYMGLIPGAYTVTSQIIVTFTLALIVMGTVVGFGIWKHGKHFLNVFVPKGLPVYLTPIIAVIEFVSFLSRPISLSVRLFANMLAGHVALKIFGGFVLSLSAAGGLLALLSPLPIVRIVAVTALEVLVCGLQAFVFTVLSCIYLNDALHPGH
ncbi:MAG: F0F1 ATP synthase subunit A [Methylobacteriaceae bacterium]|jgi:F-type H+-transporting ATPase subunit a|nr:F0F1 ATP synthase subunit A [Methylobacteriaceae bacterium]